EGTGAVHAGVGVTADRMVETISNTLCAILYLGAFSLTSRGAAAGATAVAAGALLLALLGIGLYIGLVYRGRQPFADLIARVARERLATALRFLSSIEKQLGELLRDRPGLLVSGVAMALGTEALNVLTYFLLLAAFGVYLPLPILLLTMFA